MKLIQWVQYLSAMGSAAAFTFLMGFLAYGAFTSGLAAFGVVLGVVALMCALAFIGGLAALFGKWS